MNKIRSYFKNEYTIFRNTVSLPEYIWWWLVRLGMIGVIINAYIKHTDSFVIMMLEINFFMTFIIPAIRTVCFAKLFFGNIPYNAQSFIDIFILTGSLLGHGFGFNGTVANYDKFLHIISGGVVVFVGYLIINNIESGKKLSPGLKTVASAGLSSVVIIVWEIFEFMSDFFLIGSNNQNCHFNPTTDNPLMNALVGKGIPGDAQFPVLDTDMDIICAAIGIMICCSILFVYLQKKEKKQVAVEIKETVTK